MLGRKIALGVLLIALLLGWKYWFERPNATAGGLAQDFRAETVAGVEFNLSDLRGDYVLLEFWGSWCGPCRKKLPKLAKLNERYSTELTIVSIAIETDSLSWKRALARDARDWEYQAMERRNGRVIGLSTDAASSAYAVKSIPSMVFIGPDGRVLEVNPSPASVADYLDEHAR